MHGIRFAVNMVLRTRSLWTVATLLLIASATPPTLGQDSALSQDNEVIEEEKGFLIVRKSAIPAQSVVGSNLTIVIEIHNAGSSSAYDVSLQDQMPPSSGFTLLEGASTANYDRINAGVTKRHSYSITPKASGVHRGMPATVTYKPEAPPSTKQQVGYSTDCSFAVLSLGQNYNRFLLKVGRVLSLGMLTTASAWIKYFSVVVVLGGSAALYWSYMTITVSRQRSRYQRALDDVAKMK